jgi:D-alanyl-D-alanine carboxypeptidase (penicillin-binding protein 5/6)
MGRSFTLVLGVFLGLTASFGSTARPTMMPAPPQISASAYLLIDADSGRVIVEHNADQTLGPASLTKLMTSYVLSYALAEGHVSNSDQVLISKNAWSQNPVFSGSSLMWIEVGKEVELADLHRGIVVSSGNDASVAVAEHIAGSESAFADIMNQHADILGMTNTHYVNSHGLPAPEHYTSARDLATLARAIIKQFPEEYRLYSEREFSYNNIRQYNRNSLMAEDSSVDGLKTGHTSEAGYCLVASAKKQDMRLISVVLGARSESVRKRESKKLLSYGFRFFETHKLYTAGEHVLDVRVWQGLENSLSLGIETELYLTIPRGRYGDLQASTIIEDVIAAPVSYLQTLGAVQIKLSGETLLERPLVALQAVGPSGFFARLWDQIVLLFAQIFGGSGQ